MWGWGFARDPYAVTDYMHMLFWAVGFMANVILTWLALDS